MRLWAFGIPSSQSSERFTCKRGTAPLLLRSARSTAWLPQTAATEPEGSAVTCSEQSPAFRESAVSEKSASFEELPRSDKSTKSLLDRLSVVGELGEKPLGCFLHRVRELGVGELIGYVLAGS